MIKFLIISILVIFVFARISGFIFKLFYWLSGAPQPDQRFNKKQDEEYQTKSWHGMNIRIPKKKNKNRFDDGDYVDYEEVK